MSIVRVAVIGGTGFEDGFAGSSAEVVSTQYGEVTVLRSLTAEYELYFIARHSKGHSVPPHRINHLAHIEAMRLLSIKGAIGTAAVGSLRVDYNPGSFVVLSDFIDLTRGDVTTLFDSTVCHTDFTEPYSAALRAAILQSSPKSEIVHQSGVYVSVSGPRYETPAEIRLFRTWGGDVVGMTGGPEAVLCREAGIPYAGIAAVTNFGCGLSGEVNGPAEPLSHGDVSRAMMRSAEILSVWTPKALALFAKDV